MRLERDQVRSIVHYAVIVLVVFVGWKFIPVYVAATRFKVDVYEATRDGATTRASESAIRERITWAAKNLEIPLRSEDLRIDIDPKSRLVTSRTMYEVPVRLLVTTVNLKFHTLSSQFPTISAADFKEPSAPDEPTATGAPAGSGPSVPSDWNKNPPSSGNSQSAH